MAPIMCKYMIKNKIINEIMIVINKFRKTLHYYTNEFLLIQKMKSNTRSKYSKELLKLIISSNKKTISNN